MQKSRNTRISWLAAELSWFSFMSHGLEKSFYVSSVFLFIYFPNYSTFTSPKQSDISGEWQATTVLQISSLLYSANKALYMVTIGQ